MRVATHVDIVAMCSLKVIWFACLETTKSHRNRNHSRVPSPKPKSHPLPKASPHSKPSPPSKLSPQSKLRTPPDVPPLLRPKRPDFSVRRSPANSEPSQRAEDSEHILIMMGVIQ